VVDGAKAELALIRLSRLYHYILTSGAEQTVALEREIDIVNHYLELEKLRHGAKLSFSVDTRGDISRVRLPGLLIQPLVENSIRHAIAPRTRPGRVWVQVVVADERCNIIVEDDGDGKRGQATRGAGFGLRSVQQRLTLMYGDEYSLAISRPAGHRVEIEIPLAPAVDPARVR
jgi:LytS/YehU family sensor histidine kinase